MSDPLSNRRALLLQAILPHIVFDGWSDAALAAAARDIGMEAGEARTLCPRGALDLAVAHHRAGDDAMVAELAAADPDAMRIRDRITLAVWLRLEAVPDKEAVRRATALFALPQHSAEGAALIWGTADRIWTVLGDPSEDLNWYTKRATLSAVYGSTVLFWLGDDSPGNADTRAFLDRRIGNVMQVEKTKAALRANPAVAAFMKGPGQILDRIRAPRRTPRDDLPGRWSGSDPS